MRHSLEFIERRLLARSAVNEGAPVVNGCWCREWLGATRGGYGRIWDGERLVDAHRLAFEVWTGRVPEDRVLHRCDNPRCIEGAHLWDGSAAENTADMVAKGRHLAGRVVAARKMKGRRSEVRGEVHPLAKLTEGDVRKIKRCLARGRYKTDRASSLAREYGVSGSLIRGIAMGRNWSWL